MPGLGRPADQRCLGSRLLVKKGEEESEPSQIPPLTSLQRLSGEGKSVFMNQAVETLVSQNQVSLKSLCHAQRVRELGLFGSAVSVTLGTFLTGLLHWDA
jgi:hypothetical protein